MSATSRRRPRRILPVVALALTATVLVAGCGDETSSTSTADDPSAGPADPVSTGTADATDGPTDGATGSDTETADVTATSSPTTDPLADYPACGTVWVDGKRLPGAFDGCVRAGKLVRPNGRYCEFGQPLLSFGTHFYAVPGGIIHQTPGPLKQDPGYQKAVSLCQG